MRFKFSNIIAEAQGTEFSIAAITWSPNNTKLGVATSDRAILLYDETGVRRDKFNTKPADSVAGRKSYVITGIAFSGNSEMLGVAQSDSMVFVYRLGPDWTGKKVICNKFPLSSAASCLLWNGSMFVVGTMDGKVRGLDCKSNKSSLLWTANTGCVSLASTPPSKAMEQDSTYLCSGHMDGTIYTNGRAIVRHTVPPTAMSLLTPNVIVGGCDGRVVIYDMSRGSIIRNVERPQYFPPDKCDITTAAVSPSGQTVVLGSWDGCIVCEVREGGHVDVVTLKIPNLYSCRAITWNADGTKLAVASQTGAVMLFEAVLRRWVWRDSVEVRHAGAQRVLLSRLARDAPTLVVDTTHGDHIYNVRFMGNDWYAVCRTNNSLIVCDLARGLTSEVVWTGGGGERFYMQVGPACLVHRAGELSVIEYGENTILATVRTERVNPHILSVRINESETDSLRSGGDNKKLAYLLDKQTVAVIDLMTGVQIAQSWHDARIDWLELSESAHVLLARDVRRRLLLLHINTTRKDIIASGVGFVQWIENSNAVVAQTPTNLIVWYSIDEQEWMELLDAGGGQAVGVETIQGGGVRVLLQEGSVPYVELDTARFHFNKSLSHNDMEGCASYLRSVPDSAGRSQLWRQLAGRAMNSLDLPLAAMCYTEMGDAARGYFLEKTISMAKEEGNGDLSAGLKSPLISARMLTFSGNLKEAVDVYVQAGMPAKAIQLYRDLYRWQDALDLADWVEPTLTSTLKEQYMNYLTTTGRWGAAGTLLAAQGDVHGAVSLWLSRGLPRRAARALTQSPQLLNDTQLVDDITKALIKDSWWEMAGEVSERRGDYASAVQQYARGHSYARAVQMARAWCPGEVTVLERAWGEWLVSHRQAGAAVAHLVEAGDARGALAAALAAHHWKKAMQILQGIGDMESVQEYCEQLGEHFISTEEWKTAEEVLVGGGRADRLVTAYNTAGRPADGLRIALQHMDTNHVHTLYWAIANDLRKQGQLRKAEAIYVGLGEYDEAIAMYKDAGSYDGMVRLVGTHRPELLEATRRHVAQASQAAGQLRVSEKHYLDAGDWKSVIQMYRAAGQWENADRVAQQHAPAPVQQQVAFLWANSLGGESGARLLRRRGLLAAGVRWACGARRWQLALALCDAGAPVPAATVHAHMAAALEDDGKLEEAEEAYVRGGGAGEAVAMWLHAGQHARALTLAQRDAPDKVNEVLEMYASWAAEQGDMPLYEAMMIRANRPHHVVTYYKENGMWSDALRVCSSYLPGDWRALAAEARQHGADTQQEGEDAPRDVPQLLQTAAQYANSGAYWEAVMSLVEASAAAASEGEVGVAERAALRAARLARDHLTSQDVQRAAPLLYQRLAAIGKEEVGERIRDALLTEKTDDHPADEIGESSYGSGATTDAGAGRGRGVGGGEVAQLEELARTGQWERCLVAATAAGVAAHYANMYAAHLLRTTTDEESDPGVDRNPDSDRLWAAARALLRHGAGGDGSVADVTVGGELLSRASSRRHPHYDMLRDVRDTLHAQMWGSPEGSRRVQAAVLLCVRCGCGNAGSGALQAVAVQAALALLRYTDIVVADRAFYMAGTMLRTLTEAGGRTREAFVLLNHCLDLAEAAEEGSKAMLDHTDFEHTDFPQNVLLLDKCSVTSEELDDIREWVLAISMDQSVEQSLPLDPRGVYECSLDAGKECCVLTGYPLCSRVVNFTNGRSANRSSWSRLHAAARSDPASPPADILHFITMWCGPSDYTLA